MIGNTSCFIESEGYQLEGCNNHWSSKTLFSKDHQYKSPTRGVFNKCGIIYERRSYMDTANLFSFFLKISCINIINMNEGASRQEEESIWFSWDCRLFVEKHIIWKQAIKKSAILIMSVSKNFRVWNRIFFFTKSDWSLP